MKKINFSVRRIFSVGIIALIICTLTACQSKEEKNISDLRDLVEKIDKQGNDLDEEEWDEIIKEYDQIVNENSKDCKYTNEQLEEIGKLQGQFMRESAEYYAKKFGKDINNAVQQAGSLLNGVMKGLTGDDE